MSPPSDSRFNTKSLSGRGVIFPALFLLCMSAPLQSQKLPVSERSRSAAERVREDLSQALRENGMRYGNPVFIRILKEEAEMELYVEEVGKKTFKLFRTYRIAAMSGQLGPKEREGDLQAPEGFYYVSPRQMNPYSRFHLSFNLGYPNAYDRSHGRTGSHLMVHGNRVSIGCFAMTDPKIESYYVSSQRQLRLAFAPPHHNFLNSKKVARCYWLPCLLQNLKVWY